MFDSVEIDSGVERYLLRPRCGFAGVVTGGGFPAVGQPMTSELPWPKGRTGPQVRVEKADAQAMELAPVIAQIRASGARTLQAIADELNARGIQAARAEKWGTSSVSRLRARIDKLKGIASARELRRG
jgi:hypothetical protein